jgi:hypothetical protein
MKKILLTILVLMFTFTCFATSSPTLKGLTLTRPEIPFEFVTDIEDSAALSIIYDLFGTRLANKFAIYEALDIEVEENWGIIEFQFMYPFTDEDTVIAVFDNDESEFVMLFLEYEDGWFPIDFSLVPIGFNRMYIVSDYER